MPIDPRIQAAIDAPLRHGASIGELPTAKSWRSRGYFAAPGGGPINETCGSCKHIYRHQAGRKTVHKCRLTKFTWSAHSDVSSRSPACAAWEARDAG